MQVLVTTFSNFKLPCLGMPREVHIPSWERCGLFRTIIRDNCFGSELWDVNISADTSATMSLRTSLADERTSRNNVGRTKNIVSTVISFWGIPRLRVYEHEAKKHSALYSTDRISVISRDLYILFQMSEQVVRTRDIRVKLLHFSSISQRAGWVRA